MFDDEQNPLIRAAAFRSAKAKLEKIKELDIYPDMPAEEQTAVVRKLVAKKLEAEPGLDKPKTVKGQRWYVEALVRFSALNAKDKLDFEYMEKFPDIAGQDEMVQELEDIETRP